MILQAVLWNHAASPVIVFLFGYDGVREEKMQKIATAQILCGPGA